MTRDFLTKIKAFWLAVAVAGKILNAIECISAQDPGSEKRVKLDNVEGIVELRNVKHIHPSRLEVCVLDDASPVVPAGKTAALVSALGSGKSPIIGLIERFYEPVGGQVLLDGHDISTSNLRCLRRQRSPIHQEPVLFNISIFENIGHGLIGTSYENASRESPMKLIVKAANKANVRDFIFSTPQRIRDVGW